MIIKTEMSLCDFEFWSGAVSNAELFTKRELKHLDSYLGELNPDGMTDTEINDLFWFDVEHLCELLGYEYDYENDEIIREPKEEEE